MWLLHMKFMKLINFIWNDLSRKILCALNPRLLRHILHNLFKHGVHIAQILIFWELTFSNIRKYVLSEMAREFSQTPDQPVPREVSRWVLSYQHRNEIWPITGGSAGIQITDVTTHNPDEVVINTRRKEPVLSRDIFYKRNMKSNKIITFI